MPADSLDRCRGLIFVAGDALAQGDVVQEQRPQGLAREGAQPATVCDRGCNRM